MFESVEVMQKKVKAGSKEAILEEARRLVHLERIQEYGHPLDDFSRTAGMATAMLSNKLMAGCTISPEEVGLFMILVKVSRQVNKSKRDNMVDVAGYAETVQMVVEEGARRKALSKKSLKDLL